ncbi:MAG: hypothetical protein WA160_10590 [Pseudobdellovibrio sp.]
MEKALIFLIEHNILVVKSIFAIIFLGIIVYMYRQFYINTSASGANGEAIGNEEIDKKLNQILENQKKKVIVDTSLSGNEDDSAKNEADSNDSSKRESVSNVEVERYRLEIQSLKQLVTESDKKLEAAKTSAAAPVDNGQAQLIKSLEARLAEYEIIAEDISELSQLRAENVTLKAQLGIFDQAPPAEEKAPVKSEPVAAAVKTEPVAVASLEPPVLSLEEMLAMDEPIVEQAVVHEAAVEAIVETLHAETEVVAEVKEEAAIEVPKPLSEQEAADAIVAELIGQSGVTEEEQKLLNEFEQTIVKKG